MILFLTACFSGQDISPVMAAAIENKHTFYPVISHGTWVFGDHTSDAFIDVTLPCDQQLVTTNDLTYPSGVIVTRDFVFSSRLGLESTNPLGPQSYNVYSVDPTYGSDLLATVHEHRCEP